MFTEITLISKARPKGLEPSTPGSTVRYSNQLSYGPSLRWAAIYQPFPEESSNGRPNLRQAVRMFCRFFAQTSEILPSGGRENEFRRKRRGFRQRCRSQTTSQMGDSDNERLQCPRAVGRTRNSCHESHQNLNVAVHGSVVVRSRRQKPCRSPGFGCCLNDWY